MLLLLEVHHEADVKPNICFHVSLKQHNTQPGQVHWVSLLQRVFSGLGERGKCYYLLVYRQLLQHKGNEAQTLKSSLPDF